MSASERARSEMRIDRLAALPVAAGVAPWLKALAVAAGLGASALVAARALPVTTAPASPPLSASAVVLPPPAALPAAVASVAPSAPPAAPAAERVPAASSPRPTARSPLARVGADPSPAESAPERSAAAPSTEGTAAPSIEVAAAPSASAPEGDSIVKEALLLDQARAALGSRPAEALARLEEHAALFPRGKMGLERELMSVDALRRLGRTSQARQRAESLAARTRGTIYEARVAQLIEQVR